MIFSKRKQEDKWNRCTYAMNYTGVAGQVFSGSSDWLSEC